MKLAKRDQCPIHHSFFCCGRVERAQQVEDKRTHREPRKGNSSRWYQVAPGVHRINDEHHPRGFRERRSTAAMKVLVLRKFRAQNGICPLCELPMTDMQEVIWDHIESKGSGGAWRDDHSDNIQATHSDCNMQKGSMSMEQWEAKRETLVTRRDPAQAEVSDPKNSPAGVE